MDPFSHLIMLTTEDLPTLPDQNDPRVTRWVDREQQLFALGNKVDETYWIHVLGVASFSFEKDRTAITAFSHPSVSPDVILDQFSRSVWPMVLQIRGYEVLHASAVQTSQGVVALCAPSETGKSTLAYGLSQRGYSLWADDAVVFWIEGRVARAQPVPFGIRLRPGSAVYFGHAESEALIPYRWKGQPHQELHPLPLVTICLLERIPATDDSSLAEVKLVPSAEAFSRVMQHAQYFGLQDLARKRHMTQQYLTLVSSTPVLQVRFQNGLDRMSEIMDIVEREVFSHV